jgi:hypothetical protein
LIVDGGDVNVAVDFQQTTSQKFIPNFWIEELHLDSVQLPVD